MKKTLFTLFTLLQIVNHSLAQNEINLFDDLKKKNDKNSNVDTVATIYNGNLSIGINQGMLHNWAAGGELVSGSINGIFNGTYIKYNGPSIWTSNLDLAYGLFYAYSNKFVPRKTDDRIDLTSKYGYRLKKDKDFYFTTLFNAKTQFTEAFNYDLDNWTTKPISRAFSPLYLTLAPGIEYRKGSEFSLFFSPAAMRFTFASKEFTSRLPEGMFGIDYNKNMRFELGAYLTSRYQKAISKSLTYNGRFDLYMNYLAKDVYRDNVLVKKDNVGNIDILWDNNLSYNFLKFFSINIGLLGIYDNDLPYTYNDDDPTKGLGWWQIKQYMNIGFNYKF